MINHYVFNWFLTEQIICLPCNYRSEWNPS